MRFKLLTRKNFREWLEEQSAFSVVGDGCNSNYCPIAKFVKNKTKLDTSVGDLHLIVTTQTQGMKSYALPQWARKFVLSVDRFHTVAIFRNDALMLLDRI